MSRRGPGLGWRWRSWTRDAGLGFSYREERADGIRADMAPAVNPETQLTEWRAILWRGTERANVLAEVWAPTHWDCARAVEAKAAELRRAVA